MQMNQMTEQQNSGGSYNENICYILNLSIYSWALKFPTIYYITVKAPAGLDPNEVLEKIKSGEIAFEAESYDSFTPGDFMKHVIQKRIKS